MDKVELLWKCYEDNREFARHHENQRSTASNITMIVSAGIIGLLTVDGQLSVSDLPLTLFLSLLGVFGAAFSAKLYERVRLHLYRAEQFLVRLEELVPDSEISELRSSANAKTLEKFPRLHKVRLFRFWVVLHFFIAGVGIIMTIIILYQILEI